MKEFAKKYNIIFIITVLSSFALCALSYLTVLDYSNKNEESYIETCNQGVIREIETSLSYGKSLTNYFGMEDVLERAASLLSEGSIIVLETPEGEVISSSLHEESFRISLSENGEVRQEIHGPDGNVEGTLLSYYSNENIRKNLTNAFRSSLIGSLIIITLIILGCLIGARFHLSDKKILFLIVAGITIQGIFLTINYRSEFETASIRNVESTAKYLGSSIEGLLEKGVSIDEISDLDSYLEGIKKDNPLIEDLYIDNTAETPSNSHEFNLPLSDDSSLVLTYRISESYIRKNVFNMALMFIATIILAVIMMWESLALSDLFAFRRSKQFNTRSKEQFSSIARAIRYGNFLSVTFDYICLSFSALQIREWNQGAFGLPPATAAALSISICSIADLFGMLCMPSIGKKIRPRILMIASVLILIISNINCFLTGSTMIMILMRFFSGLGTAGVKQVRNTIIANGYSNESERSANLAASNNGVIGGILCGMGLGGVMADALGYQATFLVAAIGNILFLLFEFFLLPWGILAAKKAASFSENSNGSLPARIFRVFRKRNVWRTILLIVLPQYFLLMVIVCLIPARIQSQDLPGTVLTYSNLLNGLAGLYLGERICRFLQNKFHSDSRVQALVLLVGAISMAILNLPVFVTGMILISAVLSGLVDGIGSPVATDLFMGNLTVMTHLNDTESLMIYSVLGSAIMSVAPFILEVAEKNAIVLYICCGLLLLSALMLGIRRKRKKNL